MKTQPPLNLPTKLWLALPIAATVAIAACAPQVAQNASGSGVDVPTAVEQVKASQALPAGTFEGLIASHDGKQFVPVANATVAVKGTNTLALTDSTGHYVIAGIKPGAHAITVTAAGYAAHETTVNLSPVAGTPRVNVALSKASYDLKAITAFPATVSGVVKDPRGAALPNAKVRLTTTTGGVDPAQSLQANADVNGFYNVTYASVEASTNSPGQVQVTAWGTSPGGVRLETSAVAAKMLTGAVLVIDPKCDAFTRPKNLTYPNGAFLPMGSSAKLKAEWMSTRPDEFYLDLVSGGQHYAVLADSIVNTIAGVNDTPPQSSEITFRIPYTMPANNFTVNIVPFGITTAPLAGPFAFIVRYEATDFETDVQYTLTDGIAKPAELNDAGSPAGLAAPFAVPSTAPNLNGTLYAAGEAARYTLYLANTNGALSQDVKLEGKLPAGSSISSVRFISTSNDVPSSETTVAPANVTVNPDGTFAVVGLTIPAKVGLNRGGLTVSMLYETALGLAKGTDAKPTNLKLTMVSQNLVKATAPGAGNALTVANIDPAKVKFTADKSIVDSGVGPNDGEALVQLKIKAEDATALGAIKLQDVTLTDVATVAEKATITGATAIPGATGFGVSDGLQFEIDGVSVGVAPLATAGTPEGVVSALTGFFAVAGGGGKVEVAKTGDNKLTLTRTEQGAGKSFQILSGGSSVLARTALGLDAFVDVIQAGKDGITADLDTATATMAPGGTAFTFANKASTQVASGGGTSVTAAFTLVPPAAFAVGDSFDNEITVSYKLKRTAVGTAVTYGGGATGAFGARLLAVNLLAPFNVLAKDQNLPNVLNVSRKDDPVAMPF